MVRRWTGPNATERKRQAEIAHRLAEIGFALPGSVTTRSYRCGKSNCACHREPPRLHGPYTQWTRQVDGRTIHVNLSAEQLEDYTLWFENGARIHRLVQELESLTLGAVERDPRFRQR